MLLMSKEFTDKDRSMKTQLLLSTSGSDEKISGEKVWKVNGYFDEVKPEMNIEKVNIPENTLLYVNQGFISTVKNGDLAMYAHNFIIGQLLVAANQPEDISQYQCKENETKLLTCVYDLESGKFKGLRLMLAYIMKMRSFFLMVSLRVNLKFSIHMLSNRFRTLSLRPHSKNIFRRFSMKEKMKLVLICFITYLLYQIERRK